MRPDRPYNDLPLLPPTKEIETQRILRSCIQGRVALVELNAAGARIPNQSVLLNSIPVLEAQASTAIEDIHTTADQMFRFARVFRPVEPDSATLEALRYREALLAGVDLVRLRPLSAATAISICRIIKGIDLEIRKIPGVAIVNQASGAAIYTPPEGEERIRDLLSNWEHYLHDPEDPDPLIRMAVMHYQFEAIHPFADGNGRTGRVLNLLYLMERGLLDQPVLHLSRALIRRRDAYYRLLLRVTTDAEWEEWVFFMIEAVTEAARWTTGRIETIREIMMRTTDTIRDRAPKLPRSDLVRIMFERPYIRIGDLVEAGIAKRQTAAAYLRELCGIGVLEVEKQGRDKLFASIELRRLLTEDDGALTGS